MSKDYSGFATREFAEMFNRYLTVPLTTFADQIGMDIRDLKRIVGDSPKHDFVGLKTADRLMMGLGMNITEVVRRGEVTVIPGSSSNDALKMAEDEFWVRQVEADHRRINERADELRFLRDAVMSRRSQQV